MCLDHNYPDQPCLHLLNMVRRRSVSPLPPQVWRTGLSCWGGRGEAKIGQGRKGIEEKKRGTEAGSGRN